MSDFFLRFTSDEPVSLVCPSFKIRFCTDKDMSVQKVDICLVACLER